MTERIKELASILSRMREELTRLAARPEEQIVYLQDLGVGNCADELALEFDESVLMLDQLRRSNLIRNDQAEAIRAVDRKLAEMSGAARADLWTWSALERSLEWRAVRELASKALAIARQTMNPACRDVIREWARRRGRWA